MLVQRCMLLRLLFLFWHCARCMYGDDCDSEPLQCLVQCSRQSPLDPKYTKSHVLLLLCTSSCARSTRFATFARTSLHSLCHRALQCVLWSSASLAPTEHIYKLVSERYRDCNGNNSAHVQGRRQLDLVFIVIKSI